MFPVLRNNSFVCFLGKYISETITKLLRDPFNENIRFKGGSIGWWANMGNVASYAAVIDKLLITSLTIYLRKEQLFF